MSRSGAFGALALFLASCAQGPASNAALGDLEVAVEVEGTGSVPRIGDLATLVFRVHNRSKYAVILKELTQPRDLMLSGSSGAVVTWQFSQAGFLIYNPEQDTWTYEKGRRAEIRRPVFNSGLLVADERLVVRAKVRLLEMPMDFQFSYFELSPDDLRRKVYFEDRGPKISTYRTLVGRELDQRLVPSLRPEESGHRFVIFPHAEPIASSALLKTFRLEKPLRSRYFSLDLASQKAGIPRPRRGEYTYSTLFEGWILPKDGGYVLATSSSLTPLPELRQMERIIHLIDTTLPEKITVELRAHSAATALAELRYPVVRQEREIPVSREVKEKREYYFLFLPGEQLLRFFADLRALKLALDAEYGEGGGSLVVHNG